MTWSHDTSSKQFHEYHVFPRCQDGPVTDIEPHLGITSRARLWVLLRMRSLAQTSSQPPAVAPIKREGFPLWLSLFGCLSPCCPRTADAHSPSTSQARAVPSGSFAKPVPGRARDCSPPGTPYILFLQLLTTTCVCPHPHPTSTPCSRGSVKGQDSVRPICPAPSRGLGK